MSSNNDFTQLKIQSLEHQLAGRLDKLWKIFSWTSSILVTIIGGLVFLSLSKEYEKFETEQRVIISIVVITLVAYAYLWIGKNLALEGQLRDRLHAIFRDIVKGPQIYANRPDKIGFGYRWVLLLLGLAAIGTTWWDRIQF